jgi:hypothetical protein
MRENERVIDESLRESESVKYMIYPGVMGFARGAVLCLCMRTAASVVGDSVHSRAFLEYFPPPKVCYVPPPKETYT